MTHSPEGGVMGPDLGFSDGLAVSESDTATGGVVHVSSSDISLSEGGNSTRVVSSATPIQKTQIKPASGNYKTEAGLTKHRKSPVLVKEEFKELTSVIDKFANMHEPRFTGTDVNMGGDHRRNRRLASKPGIRGLSWIHP